MLRFRLTHTTRQAFGSSTVRHVWVGQQWDALTELWEDQTNEYPTAQEAELALLRAFVDQEFEQTFEY
jgi:hypothetical protein